LDSETEIIRAKLRAPRSAGAAGILFATLLITNQTLIFVTIPADASSASIDIVRHSKAIEVAFNLLPFAGIAFLWFIAVVRDRLGELEDRFFTTVFVGSGLLYVAMIFTAGAIAGALLGMMAAASENLSGSGVYPLGRAEIYRIMSVYGTEMSGVFMMSGSTIFVRTRVVPSSVAWVGYLLALSLLLGVGSFKWVGLVFPVWVILISACILLEQLRREFGDRRLCGDGADVGPNRVGGIPNILRLCLRICTCSWSRSGNCPG